MTERQWYALCAAILVVTAAIDAYTPLGIAAGVGYLLAVVVAGRVYEVRFPWRVAAVSIGLILRGFCCAPPGGVVWIGATNRVGRAWEQVSSSHGRLCIDAVPQAGSV